MEYILGENYRLNDFINAYKNQLEYIDASIPIIDFGKHEYGDLSYTIGAICLYKLSEFVGIDVFDKATSAFLAKYKDTPVDMEIFCSEYIRLCDNTKVERFFEDWVYTTNGVRCFQCYDEAYSDAK